MLYYWGCRTVIRGVENTALRGWRCALMGSTKLAVFTHIVCPEVQFHATNRWRRAAPRRSIHNTRWFR